MAVELVAFTASVRLVGEPSLGRERFEGSRHGNSWRVSFHESIENVGKAIDVVGVAALVLGVVVATVMAVRSLRAGDTPDPYRQYRQRLGRAILLGLELLVAADIIRTVAVTPTFESAGVLAIIVAIRTFLSISLEVELEGRWPWSART